MSDKMYETMASLLSLCMCSPPYAHQMRTTFTSNLDMPKQIMRSAASVRGWSRGSGSNDGFAGASVLKPCGSVFCKMPQDAVVSGLQAQRIDKGLQVRAAALHAEGEVAIQTALASTAMESARSFKQAWLCLQWLQSPIGRQDKRRIQV